MEKVLLIIGDAAEALDTMYPYYRRQEEGYQAVVAGPDKRVYPLIMHEILPGWEQTAVSVARRGIHRLFAVLPQGESVEVSSQVFGQPGSDPVRAAEKSYKHLAPILATSG